MATHFSSIVAVQHHHSELTYGMEYSPMKNEHYFNMYCYSAVNISLVPRPGPKSRRKGLVSAFCACA